MIFEPDNIVQWIFEKMFDQITSNGQDCFVRPFNKILSKTFDNNQLHQIIHNLTKKQIIYIKEYLTNSNLKEIFLLSKLKKKLYVQILMNNLDQFTKLVNQGYRIDYKCYQLMSLNNRIEMLDYAIKLNTNIKLCSDLLYHCSEFGQEEVYFYLRNLNLMPNISIYNKAVLGESIAIVRDISECIGLNNDIINAAVQSNNTQIIEFILDLAETECIGLSANLIVYPILNCNLELIEQFNKKIAIDWHHELYYSAILSGSIEMIHFVESKIPNIHENKILDSSRTKKGKSSLLTNDIIYQLSNKKYFSHTINYAIQSKSIEVLKYIHQKGYGITPSNFVTAIRQGTDEILSYLCQNYSKKLPFYLLHYLSIYSYVSNKITKAKILYQSNLLTLDKDKFTVDDYRKESVHLQLISEMVHVTEEEEYDIDWLLKYCLFFIPLKGFKLNYCLLTKLKLYLDLNIETELDNIFSTKFNEQDQQLITDILFLFGNISQIIKYCPQFGESSTNTSSILSTQIIMEIICYGQINKICYLLQYKILNRLTIEKIYPLITMISDPHLDKIAEKMNLYKPNIKYLIQSKKISTINEKITKYPEILNEKMDKETIKNLLLLDEIQLVEKFNIKIDTLLELKSWALEMELVQLIEYIELLTQNKNF